jgi:hopanoid biosynthesis associated RND transporter like protein HpnN
MSTEEQRAPLIHRLLAAFVGGVCSRPRLVLAAALAFAGLSVYLAATRLEYQTHRDDLLDPGKECQKRWHQYLAEFGDDNDMVVVVRGSDREQMKLALDDVATHIAARPDLFDRLFYKVDLRPLHNRALMFLPADEIQAIRDRLQPMGALLKPGRFAWQHFTLQYLLTFDTNRRLKLAGAWPDQPLGTEDEQSFRQAAAILKAADATLADPADYRNPWSGVKPPGSDQEALIAEPQYFFSSDGQLAFLLARPKQEAGSFTADRASVEGLRAVLAEARQAHPDVEIGLTGLPVLENDEMVASRHDTELASWLALAAVVVLYLVVFRGLYYPMLTVGTLLVGIAWSLGWLTVSVGHLNILSATFAVMLIAMGDYGVLWVTRYEQARRWGMDVRAALVHTATHVAVGNLTAATALALAFFAAMLADFRAVAELGWIAGCGVLFCALACFTVLPAVLMLADRRGLVVDGGRWTVDGERILRLFTVHRPPSTVHQAAGWLPRLSARPWLVIGTTAALAAGLGIFATRVQYDHNLLHLQAPDLDAVKWERTLIEHTDGASWHALSTTNTPEEALALKARYEKLPEVSRVVEIASLVPREQDHKIVLLREIAEMLKQLPARGMPVPHDKPALDDPQNTAEKQLGQLRATLAVLVNQLQSLARAGSLPVLAHLGASARALHDRLGGMDGALALQRLSEFEVRLKGDLAEDLHRLRDVSTPAPITLDDLPPALRERYVGRSGKWLLCVFAKDCLWDYGPLEHFTRQVQTVDPDATGKPFGTVEGLRALRSGFQWAGLYALGVIVLVLLADFRSIRHALVALAPLAMGMVLSLGVLGLCGLPLNPANMIALPLILGVGIDNGVHVLHDYLLRRREGQSTISRAIGRGVLVKALTTMIGFGTLMISNHRGLFGLGFILTLGVGCCMLTALVFLPAVLRLLGAAKMPLRNGRRHKRRVAA